MLTALHILSLNRARKFAARLTHRTSGWIGHNLPQEAPKAFADAIYEVASY